ncbi:MAG: diguanylate cyclase, partial [Clostridiales bacterium]|nr:diguanylate cyclase [Clostridiales bacterium]
MCDQTGMNEDKVRELENRLAELESRLSEQVGIIKDQAQTILEQEQTIARLKGSMGKYSESPDLLELMIKSIDNCPDIILWVNNKRDFVYVNDSACEHLGYSREELLSMNINDIDPVMKDLKTIRSMRPKEDSMDRFTAVFEKKDKTTIPVDIVGIRPLIKELTYGIMFARDMTAQVKNDKMLLEINENLKEKNEELSQLYEEVAASEEELKANNEQLVKSQEELREKNSYLDLVIKASSDGIWYRNLKTHYSVMSSPWLEAAGIDIRWDSRQAGGNWQQVIHPEDLEEAREAFTSLLNGITDKYESIYRIVTANNQIKWIRTRGISIRDDKGDPYILAGVHTDITELKDQQEQLERHAYYDALTGLPNRTLFTERLLQCFRLSRRNNTRVAILFVDIDDFKKVNDTIGHGFGDELLKETASRMQAQIREYDTIARFGGDEFIIIVQDVTDNTEIIEFASRLRHCFAEPFFYGNTTFHLGCSIGAAVYPKDGTTAEELLKNSDTAMYYAKADGKDKIKFFDQKMVSDSLGKIELENDLRAAALKMDFGIHMQPSFNMKDKSLRGVELLLRWTNIRLGNIPPDFF